MRLISTFALKTATATALPFQAPMSTASESNTTLPFSSTFHQPTPPLLKPAFKASWTQHKWNAEISHIASGYMYSSPSAKKVRVDEAYDGTFGSSLFDYNNVTEEGVYNIVWTISPSVTSTPEFFTGYVEGPAFPLVEENLLVKSNAVYAGVIVDPDFGQLTKWNFLYAGVLPTTILLDDERIVHGYDFWDPNERTFAITRLFNIVVGEVAEEVFEFPNPNRQTKL